jgi:hypothetical protein
MDKAFQRQVFFGSLAQLVEQRTFNPWVVGSNPTRPIHKEKSGNGDVAALFIFLSPCRLGSYYPSLFPPQAKANASIA